VRDKIFSFFKEYALEKTISFIAVVLLILNPQKAYWGLRNATLIYLNLLFVIISAALLASLISEAIPKEVIKKLLERESGVKGVLISYHRNLNSRASLHLLSAF